jgi:3-hydroxyanthranilate 3,4-dioxygenase
MSISIQINMMALNPLSWATWLAENEDKLRPPVNNCCLYQGNDFILMAVGGPNERNDYHGTIPLK